MNSKIYSVEPDVNFMTTPRYIIVDDRMGLHNLALGLRCQLRATDGDVLTKYDIGIEYEWLMTRDDPYTIFSDPDNIIMGNLFIRVHEHWFKLGAYFGNNSGIILVEDILHEEE